jgi:hypothetical protein
MSRRGERQSGILAGNKIWALGVAIALAAAAIIATVAIRGQRPQQPTAERQRWPLLPVEAPPETPATPETPEAVDRRVREALTAWRNAILIRDADTVVRLDMAFLEEPSMYLAALKTSARTDENERVRAFSTRELGKFKRVDLAPTFRQLLKDDSSYVRQNAAWALGELGGGADGRAAAGIAKAELRELVKRDPTADVRAAARTALERIE